MNQRKYRRLTWHDRNIIENMSKASKSQKEIAQVLGVSPATISRELKRNFHLLKYCAIAAELFALIRRFWAKKKRKLTKKHIAILHEHLQLKESLECIANTVLKGIICTQTLYNYMHQNGLHKLLFFGRKYRRRGAVSYKGQIKNRVSIECRPEEANARNRLGDWEGDLIVGANHKGAILTLVDRTSKFLLAKKLKSREADATSNAIIETLKNNEMQTLTLDNGREFASHEKVSKSLGVDVYFAHPYAPQERGTNENTNRLLRRFFPKGTDLRKVSKQRLAKAVSILNNRPRKGLGWLSPIEITKRLAA